MIKISRQEALDSWRENLDWLKQQGNEWSKYGYFRITSLPNGHIRPTLTLAEQGLLAFHQACQSLDIGNRLPLPNHTASSA